MEVKLLRYTQKGEALIEYAGRVCHRSGVGGTGTFIKKLIAMGHESVLEHASATFEVSGISRACSHQIVRHRLCSFSQESQRYVEMEGDVCLFVVPGKIAENTAALTVYGDFLGWCKMAYKKLREAGIPKEDARFVLPNATHTRLIWTANLREWRHIIKVRCSKAAQWEIRGVCKAILWELERVFPNVFDDLCSTFIDGTPMFPQLVYTIENCVRDQGLYDKRFGKIVVCTNCNKVRQMTKCLCCGAPWSFSG